METKRWSDYIKNRMNVLVHLGYLYSPVMFCKFSNCTRRFANFQNITRAHKSRNALAFVRFLYKYKMKMRWTKLKKMKMDCNWGFRKLFCLTVFQRLSVLFVNYVCLKEIFFLSRSFRASCNRVS